LRGLMTKAAPVSALLLLCLLWAFASLRSDLLPGPASPAGSSPLANQATLLAVFAVVAAVAALACKARWPSGGELGLSVSVAIGLFVAPALLIDLAKAFIDDSTRVVLFSLVPVFAVVLEPHLGSASSSQQRGGLAAGLIAVVGTLLVFPLELPQTLRAVFAFGGIVTAVAALAAANCVAVRLAIRPSAPSTFGFAAVATGSAALILGALSVFADRHPRTASLFDPWRALDLVALALLFWLMRRMTAVQMTTRFLIAPLLVNLIGLAFLRPGVQVRGWLGLSLIALGSGWLLLVPEDEPQRTGSPLRLHQP
jgi:drug/metabolite transporter (DMT)-like permease